MSEEQELRYAITSGVMDSSNPIYIAKDEFTNLKRAYKCLRSVLDIEATFDLLLENYAEFEEDFLRLSLRLSLFGEQEERPEVYREMNRRLMNLLSSARLYLDQIPRQLRSFYGGESTQTETFNQSRFKQYDSSLAYRTLEALRNHSQHFGFPVNAVTMRFEREDMSPQSPLRAGLQLFVSVERLKENRKFKKPVLNELSAVAKDGHVNLTRLVREYVEKLCEVHESLRGLIAADVGNWDQTVLSAVSRAREEFAAHFPGFTLVSGHVIPAEDGNEERLKTIESEVIFLKYTDWRKALETKNRNLGKLSNRYVTGHAG